LLNWVGANEAAAKELLPKAVERMIERLGQAAARHQMYLVVCSDLTETDGGIYNTAFLLGRDGKEIGRYHKVCPTWSEAGVRQRGHTFPVFPTRDLGTAGLLICYDLVVPETARCLALAGADIIFFPRWVVPPSATMISACRHCGCERRRTSFGSWWHNGAAEP